MVIEPYGGKLINLFCSDDEKKELIEKAVYLKTVKLSPLYLYDLEMLATGAFSPLDRFMGQEDYKKVIETMRLSNGVLFPIPVVLSVKKDVLKEIKSEREVVLTDEYNVPIALMQVEEIFERNPEWESMNVLGTTDIKHPFVSEIYTGEFCISGQLRVIQTSKYSEFLEYKLTPSQLRDLISETDGNTIAFVLRNFVHKVHEELIKRVKEKIDGTILLSPTIAPIKGQEIDFYAKMRTYVWIYKKISEKFRIILNLVPLVTRFAGPKEAILHGIVMRNYGANYIVIGPDYAGAGHNSYGKPFYKSFEAQNTYRKYEEEVGVKLISFEELVYAPEMKKYIEKTTAIKNGIKFIRISGTKIKEQFLLNGKKLPRWLVSQEIGEILQEFYKPKHKKGFCLWLTGLPCSGKSTIARMLCSVLKTYRRRITLLDGDIVREYLSKGLGFSKEEREENLMRVGFVASEIVKHDGIVICALVSPYKFIRSKIRNLFPEDQFIEIFVDAPLEVCEARDVKGMYKKAKLGLIKNFTGIDDPYEPPDHPEIHLNTAENSPQECVDLVIDYLIKKGYLNMI